MRPPKPLYYLGIARAVAARSPCTRAKYGAIIVKNDAIVSTGYNGPPRGTTNCEEGCLKDMLNVPHRVGYEVCPAIHAEENAIINAARNGSSVLGGTMYLYGYDARTGEALPVDRIEPCLRCKKRIINAGISQVIVPKGNSWLVYEVSEWARIEKEKYARAVEQAKRGASLADVLEIIK